jgi:hypothetical protein
VTQLAEMLLSKIILDQSSKFLMMKAKAHSLI